MKGYAIALLEVSLFAVWASVARICLPNLQLLDPIMYFWFCFTVLTGYWEFTYVTNYDFIARFAQGLAHSGQSVWSMDFPWTNIHPNLFAKMFYAEYAAHADREYKSERRGDYWSRLVESSHALCCAAYCLAALLMITLSGKVAVNQVYNIAMYGMGMQFMNSLLYMGQYYLQCRNKSSPNFNSASFPLGGNWMPKRWFMWVNLFWLVFPAVIGWSCFLNVSGMTLLVPNLIFFTGFLVALCHSSLDSSLESSLTTGQSSVHQHSQASDLDSPSLPPLHSHPGQASTECNN